MKLRHGLIMLLAILAFLFVMPCIVNANVEYTRTIPSNDGSIILNLTGLELDDGVSYSYALTTKGIEPTTWHNLIDYTNTTASIPLSSATQDIVNVLKSTNKGYLYIKNNTDNSYVLNALEVNLTLPLLQGSPYSNEGTYYKFSLLYNSIGNEYTHSGNNNTFTQTQKITDSAFIEKFLDIKNNNKSITSLESYLPTIPNTGYSSERTIYHRSINNGLYIIWVKRTGNNCKDVYSAVIHDGLPEATTVNEYLDFPNVKSIQVVSPVSGTYNTTQTVKIRVIFDKKITGTTVPTLVIKFGESAERSVTNGTISNNYIEYSYNIQAGDNGQLATVSLTGGTIKDISGNVAVLSCPIISGHTIKANTEGINNNNTGNQDTNNDNDNNNNNNNNNDNNSDNSNINNGTGNQDNNSNNNNSNNNQANKADDSAAKGKLPQTGATIAFLVVIVSVIGIGVFAFSKYRSLKDI